MPPMLIIKTGNTLNDLARRKGDFEDWIAAPLKDPSISIQVAEVHKGGVLPDPRRFCGVIITGSHAFVTDRERWSEGIAAWIPRVIEAGIPLLGICFGHQLLAHALGGIVDMCPSGPEYGVVDIRLHRQAQDDALFGGFPEAIKVYASHSQSVICLPPGATLLASSADDRHHAFAVNAVTWGLQFHPEFDADIMSSYIRAFADALQAAGKPVDRLLARVEALSLGPRLLKRFARVARSLCASQPKSGPAAMGSGDPVLKSPPD